MKIEVILSPLLYAGRTLTTHHTTVAVDVLRATTAICAAFEAGAETIVPLDSLEPLPRYRQLGFALAAERNGSKVGDAEYGNSPTEYLRHDLKGYKLAYSTTNGTVTLLAAADADTTYTGAFANLSALADRLASDGNDIVVLCSGWKGEPCLEDTLFAGALTQRLVDKTEAETVNDAASMALTLWQQACADPYAFCSHATHIARLRKLGAGADVEFAFRLDTCPVVPRFADGVLRIDR
ncbi:MAG: 2-phosphosulfolactate phosphatase [Bacteroidales bacterium]|nr:2-phosphosulfolactate phosphatase [Bacteroidales bacterium]